MAEGTAPSDGHCHEGFPSNHGQDNNAQETQPREALRDAHGREDTLAMDRPPSSSTKSLGKAIQAYDEEHDGSPSSTKLIPKANADKMKGIDMDDSLKLTPVPKINQPPKILSYLNDTRDHSPSRDEGRDHDPRASNCGHDDNTHIGESSITRSTGVVRDAITSPGAAELAKGTAAASSSMNSVIQVDRKNGENVNCQGGPSASLPSPTKAVQDATGSAEHTLAVGRPPSSCTKSRGKAIEVQMQPDAGSSVQAPAQHHDGVVAAIGGPAHPNASDSVASNVAPAIPAVAQPHVNVAIAAIGGGVGGGGHAPAQINGGGIPVIAAPPAPAPIPVPVLPPNPGVNNNDPLTNSGIRLLRNPADGDEGKIWDKLN